MTYKNRESYRIQKKKTRDRRKRKIREEVKEDSEI